MHDYQVWDVEHTYIVVFDLFLIHVICVVISKSEELKNIFDIGVWIVDVVLQRSFVSNIINWVVSFLFLLTHLWMYKNYNSNMLTVNKDKMMIQLIINNTHIWNFLTHC